jgi:alkanesulfonate monooxygenase SsuD/methylene tetrahydromethanopterin reductase-like flavin-dependent oxidoreductase (luciferase family)
VIAPVLPVVAETDGEARAIVDRLLALVPIDDGSAPAARPAFPPGRSLAEFLDVAGIAPDHPARRASVDDSVDAATAAAFVEPAARTLALVEQRTGRRVAAAREAGAGAPMTWRALIAAHAVPAAFLVGGAAAIADHFERWRDDGGADGFNVLSAFQPGQFEAFTRIAVPELRRRGLLGRTGDTLRERLGLGAPRLVHEPVPA